MDIIAIILFIIIILTVMITAYIPSDLQAQAKKADFAMFSLRYMILKFQKVPVKYLFELFEKLVDNEIEEDFDMLVKTWKLNPDQTGSIINIILEGKKSGIEITFSDIESYKINEKNYIRYIQTLNIIEEPGKDLSEEKIIQLINSDIDIPKYFELIKLLKHSKIKLSESNIISENADIIQKLISNYDKLKEENIEFNEVFLENKDIDFETKADFLAIIFNIKKSGLDLTIDDLLKLHTSEINLKDFVKALALLKTKDIENIDNQQIKKHYLKGGNGLRVVESYLEAKIHNTDIIPDKLFMLDIKYKNDFNNIVHKCIHSYNSELPQVKVLLKNGLQVSPTIILTVKDNVDFYLSDTENNNYINSFNKVVFDETEKFSSQTEILNNLKILSQNIEKKISIIDSIINRFSDISLKIIDLKINKDTLADIKDLEVKENEEKEKLKLLKAKRKFEEEMAKAVDEGKLSYNDYLKEKYIFNDDDKDLPYHTDT